MTSQVPDNVLIPDEVETRLGTLKFFDGVPIGDTKDKAEIKLQFDYDGGGVGKGGKATLYVDGEKLAEGRVEKKH